MQETRLYTLLTYAGALPFVACALLPVFAIDTVPLLRRPDVIAQVYGLAITSFVAGSHWGTYLYKRDSCPINLFVASNAIVLAVFFAFLIADSALSIAVQMLAFTVLLLIDRGLHRAGLTTDTYSTMRLRVTLVVLASLAVILVQVSG
ncbi:MAG: DUF3429 domain-containing protein [Pseudomonadota bacterium]